MDPGVDPKKIKTEVFLFPSCHRAEKEGSISNSGRWILWHYQATDPRGKSKSMGQIMIDIMKEVIDLYEDEGGKFKEPIVNLNWYKKYDAEASRKTDKRLFHQRAKERQTAHRLYRFRG